jgi:hypothetical protein
MLGIKEVPDEALQETIREYALERLRSSGEAEEVAAVVSERCQGRWMVPPIPLQARLERRWLRGSLAGAISSR